LRDDPQRATTWSWPASIGAFLPKEIIRRQLATAKQAFRIFISEIDITKSVDNLVDGARHLRDTVLQLIPSLVA